MIYRYDTGRINYSRTILPAPPSGKIIRGRKEPEGATVTAVAVEARPYPLSRSVVNVFAEKKIARQRRRIVRRSGAARDTAPLLFAFFVRRVRWRSLRVRKNRNKKNRKNHA